MIAVKNISKKLNAFKLKDISFELPKGYIMGLIGENGAGKTTLINILSGLYTADSGNIYIDEMEYTSNEERIKQDIGVVIHDEMFDERDTLIKNASRYGRFYYNYDQALFITYAERFDLDIHRKYKHLSKGEKLKFAFAFALSHKPHILLLDEPSANFDKDFRREFHEVLREYMSTGENTVIISTHLTADLEKCADYILFLKNGKQLLFGDIESIRGDYRIVSGEAYKIKLLKERIIHMEEGELCSKALVKASTAPYDSALKNWEPSIEELMYHMNKGGR